MLPVRITGTGSYVPKHIVSNSDLAKIVDTSDEWIRSRTGILRRRITESENTSHLAVKAARCALENAGLTADQLDLIIVATITPDCFTPSTACIVQKELGARHAAAFDINAACTGLIYGMEVGAQFLQNGTYHNALIIGAETLSKIINWEDRSTCVLFGDGAGAVVLQTAQAGGILKMTMHADGAKGEALECDAIALQQDQGKQENPHGTITMQGAEVFKFAVKEMAANIKEVLEKASIGPNQVAWIIPHQANARIIEAAAQFLKIDPNRFYMNLSEYGNTSSASIGIALDELNRSGKLKRGDIILLTGFGGGMTSAAVLVEW